MAVATTPDLEHLGAEEVLAYAVDRWHPRVYVACSFQKEASVIMDILLRIEPEARFFLLDTGVLFEETYETKRAAEKRYGIEVDVFDATSPDGEPWTAARCCSDRKVMGRRRSGRLSLTLTWAATAVMAVGAVVYLAQLLLA